MLALIRGLAYSSGFVLLWWWAIASVRPLDTRLGFSVPPWLQPVGGALVVLGAVLALTCVASFALVGKGTPAPFDAPREFVAAGPYRYVRNPMYIGALAVILGFGLILRSPGALAVAVVFAVLAHSFVVLYEEPSLERRFGAAYRKYKATVNRWWPRV